MCPFFFEGGTMTKKIDESTPLYVISVAAKLAGVHPQTLRTYERAKIISPARTEGNLRLYSLKDIKRVKEARRVIRKYGVNLSGARLIIKLEEEVENLRKRVKELEESLAKNK